MKTKSKKAKMVSVVMVEVGKYADGYRLLVEVPKDKENLHDWPKLFQDSLEVIRENAVDIYKATRMRNDFLFATIKKDDKKGLFKRLFNK